MECIPCLLINVFVFISIYGKTRGGGATFSLAITPSLDREMLSGSVDAGFVLVLPFYRGDLEPDCVEVSTREGSGGRA